MCQALGNSSAHSEVPVLMGKAFKGGDLGLGKRRSLILNINILRCLVDIQVKCQRGSQMYELEIHFGNQSIWSPSAWANIEERSPRDKMNEQETEEGGDQNTTEEKVIMNQELESSKNGEGVLWTLYNCTRQAQLMVLTDGMSFWVKWFLKWIGQLSRRGKEEQGMIPTMSPSPIEQGCGKYNMATWKSSKEAI